MLKKYNLSSLKKTTRKKPHKNTNNQKVLNEGFLNASRDYSSGKISLTDLDAKTHNFAFLDQKDPEEDR